jgi:hypothetical protein
MDRIDDYRGALRALPVDTWDAYLAERSRLPGPRANLELVQAVAEEAPAEGARLLLERGGGRLASGGVCATCGGWFGRT